MPHLVPYRPLSLVCCEGNDWRHPLVLAPPGAVLSAAPRSAPALHNLANEVSIISLVGQEYLGCWSVGVHDRQIAFVIGDLATRQGEGYGQAQRIDAEMDLGRKIGRASCRERVCQYV